MKKGEFNKLPLDKKFKELYSEILFSEWNPDFNSLILGLPPTERITFLDDYLREKLAPENENEIAEKIESIGYL